MPDPNSSGAKWSAGLGAAADLVGAAGSFLGGQANSAALQASAEGYRKEAQGFRDAANLEGFNIAYAGASGQLQDFAAARQIYKSESGTRADVAGAGFSGQGSAGDILRESAQQGAMQRSIIGTQTAINENTYKIQQTAYNAEADQADAAASAAEAQASAASTGGIMDAIGGVLKAGAAIAPFFL